MKNYKRLSLDEREELSRYLATGAGYRAISRMLGRSVSTICREIRRNGTTREGYRAIKAYRISRRRRRKSGRRERKIDANPMLKWQIIKGLVARRSPEQIAKKLKAMYHDDMTMQISHESIYTYLYVRPKGRLKDRIKRYLIRGHKVRKTRGSQKGSTSPIQDEVSIDERPADLEERKVPGHWEGDLIIGPYNKSALGVLVERKTRYVLMTKLDGMGAESVRKAFEEKFSAMPDEFKQSLTYDRGREMAQHKLFTENTRIRVYFAHPHSPWERGTCENTNGLIRAFFPKGTDFSEVSEKRVAYVQRLLNERPRRMHDYLSPKEVLAKGVALAP